MDSLVDKSADSLLDSLVGSLVELYSNWEAKQNLCQTELLSAHHRVPVLLKQRERLQELHLLGMLRLPLVLYCVVLYCIVLYCIVLYCIVLYCIVHAAQHMNLQSAMLVNLCQRCVRQHRST